jgi:hypothetical protein
VSVAYYMVEDDIPATVFANETMRQNPYSNLFEKNEFKQFRLVYRRRFE